MSAPEVHLKADDIHRSFLLGKRRVDVLRGISLDVHCGEVVFLCGPSGAGKTTLLYTLAGLEAPEKGKVFFEGKDLYAGSSNEAARVRNQRMGFVFQSYQLLPDLTALENVLLPAHIAGRSAENRARELMEAAGLSDRHAHLPAELSGGEQQRVAIARALLNDPAIVFADEPTGNLDSATGTMIMALLLELARREKRTVVVVTHDRELARTGDRVLEIHDGQLA